MKYAACLAAAAFLTSGAADAQENAMTIGVPIEIPLPAALLPDPTTTNVTSDVATNVAAADDADAAIGDDATTAPTNVTTAAPPVDDTTSPTADSLAAPQTQTWTTSPSLSPTPRPTTEPTTEPITDPPTTPPSHSPTPPPSASPSANPTGAPSASPTGAPSASPTGAPSATPTRTPSASPTTATPTLGPSPTPSASPSAYPTKMASWSPSRSGAPTELPSESWSPSSMPSSVPSAGPTTTTAPSYSPTKSMSPTYSPSHSPSESPIISPSAAPSLAAAVSYSREYRQILMVTTSQSLDKAAMGQFQYVYQQYTKDFGYRVGKPTIVSACVVNSQLIGIINSVRGMGRGVREDLFHVRNLGMNSFFDRLLSLVGMGNRRLQTPSDSYSLTMRFTMTYSTRVGVLDISNYNALFPEYVNSDLTKVLEDFKRLGLPVVSAGQVYSLNVKPPTPKPTSSPMQSPTLSPTTTAPTGNPTTSPVTEAPTTLPSSPPSENVVVAVPPEEIQDRSFGLGLSLGLAGAFAVSAVVAIAFAYHHHVEKKRKRAERKARDDLAQNPTHSTEMYHAHHPHGKGSGDESPPCAQLVELGPDSPGTIEMTPNADSDDRNIDHHNEQVGNAEVNMIPLREEVVSYADVPPQARQPRSPHGTMGSHGTVGRSPQGTSRSPRGTMNSRSPRGTPHGTMNSRSPHGTMNSRSPYGTMSSEDEETGKGHLYTPSPVTTQPFGEEIMFAPTQSTASDANEDGSGAGHFSTYPEECDTSDVSKGVAAMRRQAQQQRHHQHGDLTESMRFYPHMNDLMINDERFSSDSEGDVEAGERDHRDNIEDDPYYPALFDGSRDELDNYKNQDLEMLRNTVEDAVEGVEGMMGLAVTRALTVPEDASFDSLPWAGAQDNGSIEASCLCETYDWLKHNDKNLDMDSINGYFQEILNRIVITVMFGMTSPHQGAQIVHGCAAILGLDLILELPMTTLVITGMRKTNDLAQGHNFIVKAFKPFGKIEEAAIAPNNRGFGYVRFTKPESVQRALKKYRELEIEIQDVSVSVKTLKSERSR